jgi:hypothetical protein
MQQINIVFIFIQNYGRRNPFYNQYCTHILYILFKWILRLGDDMNSQFCM